MKVAEISRHIATFTEQVASAHHSPVVRHFERAPTRTQGFRVSSAPTSHAQALLKAVEEIQCWTAGLRAHARVRVCQCVSGV